jgi:hypothetical protein
MAAAAKKSGKFDYNAKVAGLEAVDRYTLRIRLKESDYSLPFILAHEPTSAVAREVIEAYADEGGRAMSNPVGTGAYKLTNWVRSSKISLEANPDYRGFVWDIKPGSDAEDQRLVKEMKGKKMPQVGRIEISIIEEDQARLLAFQGGEIDLMNMEGPLAPNVLDGGKLRPEFAKKGGQAVAFCRSRAYVYLLESAGPGRWRPGQGKSGVTTGDGDVVQRQRGDQDRPQRAGRRSVVSDSARRCRPRSELQIQCPLRSGGRQCLARPVRLQKRRRRLAHAAQRLAASHPLRVASRFAWPAAGRDVEKIPRLDRHPDGSAEG